MNRKNFSLVGAGLGLVLFLAVAMLPALLYGGYAGVLLASGIFGTPLEPTFMVRTIIIGGMILGTLGIASLFTVVGAVLGGGLSVVTDVTNGLMSKAER